jgi:hypothetical protein
MYKVTVTNTDNDERFTTTGESVIVISTNKNTQRVQVQLGERILIDFKQSVMLYALCIKTAASLCENNELLNMLRKIHPSFVDEMLSNAQEVEQINFDKLFKDLMGDNNV